MLNWRVTVPTWATFTAIVYVLYVGYGLIAPARFRAGWLLEAVLPGASRG